MEDNYNYDYEQVNNTEPQNETGFENSGAAEPVTQPPQTPYQPYYQPPVQTKYIVLPSGFTPETYNERKDIRRRARVVVIPALIMMGISFIWATVYYAVMAVLGFSSQQAYGIISEPAVLTLASLLLSIFLFTLPFILSAKVAGFRISDLMPLNRPKNGTALPYFLFGMGFCAFANIATSYAGSIFESMGFEYSVDTGDPPTGLFGFLLSLIGTSIVPGLVEEFACRGIIFGVLKKYGDAFAVITTSVIFGFMHGNFIQIPFAFLVGLVLGVIRVKTGTMLICFAVHAANNLVSVLFEYFGGGLSVVQQNIIYTLFLMLCMLTALLGILLLRNKEGEFTLEKPEHACSAGQKYKWFFTSPLVIIFAVFCLLESLMFFG